MVPGPPLWKPTSRAAERKDEHARRVKAAAELARRLMERDGRKCRACGGVADPNALDLTRRGHLHHITFRSLGGQDTAENVVRLCASCHADVHAHRLAVSGNANDKLTFEKDGKTWQT